MADWRPSAHGPPPDGERTGAYPPQPMRLTIDELAAETGTSPARIAQMVSAGILRPDGEGAFSAGDVQRVVVANAMVDAGLTVESMHQGIEARVQSQQPNGQSNGA